MTNPGELERHEFEERRSSALFAAKQSDKTQKGLKSPLKAPIYHSRFDSQMWRRPLCRLSAKSFRCHSDYRQRSGILLMPLLTNSRGLAPRLLGAFFFVLPQKSPRYSCLEISPRSWTCSARRTTYQKSSRVDQWRNLPPSQSDKLTHGNGRAQSRPSSVGTPISRQAGCSSVSFIPPHPCGAHASS